MLTYEKAETLFKSAKDKETGKPIANNTRIVKRGDCYVVKLHATDILTVTPDNTYTLNSGGWKTVTTRARLNEYAPIRLFQKKGVWSFSVNGKDYIYQDGVTISGDTVTGSAEKTSIDKEKDIRKKVNAFAKAYVESLYAGEIPAPSTGDCFYCQFSSSEHKSIGGGEHILSHIEEKYYVPSLMWRAIEALGGSQAMKHDVAYMMRMKGWENTSMFVPGGGFLKSQMTKILKRFCLRELSLSY